ncbi:DUF885 domain-containing protein [Arcanobacterium hippocoleae]|uniref:Uncharacterized protein (DUF885 family) n=1 Tax=Arcanobacterium hippocoleae TaxID=149017 RepID=A0ABU1T3I9_9ACTO|nr:DUF885 domain-containing protein [Arcanobacterium hippocoleae]MDR6939947.1 uncharacterized protein (DUF885 family) [Arcanobacterium hippocoleae]
MTQRAQTQIDKLADDYFQYCLNTSPELVSAIGMPGASETEFDDNSPQALAAKAETQREYLHKLHTLPTQDEIDRVTANALRQTLSIEIELHDLDEYGDLNNLATPLQSIGDIFDNMPQETAADWEVISTRLGNAANALRNWQKTLLLRAQKGAPIAARQVAICIAQAKRYAGENSPFIALSETGCKSNPQLGEKIITNATSARAAYAQLATFLQNEIAPHAVARDAIGRERYELRSYQFLGAAIDFDETYAWAESELARIDAAQKQIAAHLYGPGVSIKEAMEKLNTDPARMIHGTAALKAWMQETSDAALDALTGTHFEIPSQLRKLECMIAPSSSGGIYYTGPTDDFTRAGRMWWSVPEGTDTFTTWQEKTTVYHEGVPGHHLQIGFTTLQQNQLNNWRRHGSWVSGHGEGWALYAEGLMAELGFMDEPGDKMGVLDSERLRTARVMLDIGVHLEKEAPTQYQHISRTWNRDVAWQFLRDNVAMDDAFLLFELNRYLGWPGQAPSYKIGHRIWQELRTEAELKKGANFDLKDWHMQALALGSVGLDVMREALQ